MAVGTTSVRCLESLALGFEGEWGDFKLFESEEGLLSTNLFIREGFKFRVVDRLVTNFHQPRSSHLVMVNAFSGARAIESAYNHALSYDYMFFSYGDSMILEKSHV